MKKIKFTHISTLASVLSTLSLFLLFPFLFLLQACNASAQSSEAEKVWSGSISYIYTKTVHHAAPYSSTIFNKWDHIYNQSMQAKIVNGTGEASSRIDMVDTSLSREQLGSRTVTQWQVEKGTAEGAAATELSLYIDTKNNTYTIEVPIPATGGKKVKTFYCEGCGQAAAEPITSSLGEDETSILVEDEKIGTDPNVISGEKTERKKIENGEGEEVTITRWKFTKVKK